LLIEAAESGRLRGQSSDDATNNKFEMDSVQAAIMQLAERDQSIITLRFFSELPYEDIGHILKISSGAARSAASRALDKIRKVVGR
jgi:RNA polymerase sigma factor (sigma-70 family)